MTRTQWLLTAIKEHDWDDAAMHMRAAPEICSVTDEKGRLPMHRCAYLFESVAYLIRNVFLLVQKHIIYVVNAKQFPVYIGKSDPIYYVVNEIILPNLTRLVIETAPWEPSLREVRAHIDDRE